VELGNKIDDILDDLQKRRLYALGVIEDKLKSLQ
jgi:hypothetical protein